MTFYASFWDAIGSLPKRDQLPIFRAVISYGLSGYHNEVLSPSQKAFFALMQPVLDSSRKKAKSGKDGGSKPKANAKQSESKTEKAESEKEKEVENEKEKENENEHECVYDAAGAFRIFFQAYPKKAGEDNARAAWQSILSEDVPAVMDALEAFKASDGWKEHGGRFIPQAAKWLDQGQWRNPPSNGKRHLDAEEQAAITRLLEGD